MERFACMDRGDGGEANRVVPQLFERIEPGLAYRLEHGGFVEL